MTRTRSGFLTAVLAAFALALFALGASAQDARSPSSEPTVAQIYQAANTGNLARANSMIDEVLKAHPTSAKAHYVKAELAAREGKADVAKQELATAEKIAPALPFAKAESVQALRNQLSNTNASANANAVTTQPRTARQMGAADAPASSASRSFPWGTLAIVAAIVLVGVAVLRRRTSAMASVASDGYGGAAYGSNPVYPPGGGAVPPGYAPGYPQQQPSMGSSIARGVGTGLAMGAGMVAAEEIGRRMFGQGEAHAAGLNTPSLDQIDDGMRRNLNSDMGGADFGTNDGGGWDGGGGGDAGGGGGDWDT